MVPICVALRPRFSRTDTGTFSCWRFHGALTVSKNQSLHELGTAEGVAPTSRRSYHAADAPDLNATCRSIWPAKDKVCGSAHLRLPQFPFTQAQLSTTLDVNRVKRLSIHIQSATTTHEIDRERDGKRLAATNDAIADRELDRTRHAPGTLDPLILKARLNLSPMLSM